MDQRQEIKRLGQAIARLSLPVLVEQFFIVIMGIVNTMLASNLGKEVISAIGMIDTISNIIISVFGALAIGGTVVVAQYTGHNDGEKANQAAAQALMSCLLIAGLATFLIRIFQQPLVRLLFGQADPQVFANALSYLSVILWSYIPIALVNIAFGILRGAGDTRTPMKVSILMNIFNVIFSYVLIYGIHLDFGLTVVQTPGFGIWGAALGLSLARTLGAILVLIPLFRGSKLIQLGRLRHFRIQPDMQKCIFGLGIPASAEQLMFNGGKLIVQTFIVRLGTVAMAANAIATSIVSMLIIPGNAMAIAATTLVGQQIGRGQPKEAKKQLIFLTAAASVAIAIISLILWPFLDQLIRLYTHDQSTVKLTFMVILSTFIAQPLFWATSFIMPAGLRGAGDVRYTMTVSMISMWSLRILLGYVFSVLLPWGVLGIWLAMYIDWVFRSVFFMRRLRGGHWLKKTIPY